MEELLQDIDVFIAHREMTEQKFGLLALGDKRFVAELRAGREPRRKTVGRVRHFIATYQSRATPTKPATQQVAA